MTQDTSPTEVAEDDRSNALHDASDAAQEAACRPARESYMGTFRDAYEEEFAKRLGGTLDDEAEEFMHSTLRDVEEWLGRLAP